MNYFYIIKLPNAFSSQIIQMSLNVSVMNSNQAVRSAHGFQQLASKNFDKLAIQANQLKSVFNQKSILFQCQFSINYYLISGLYFPMIEESFQKVIISLNNSLKQSVFQTDLALNSTGCVLSSDLKYKIYLEGFLSQEDLSIFYYDHIRNNYVKIDEVQTIPINGLVNQNKIFIRLQPKISDQILANPQTFPENSRSKRSAQRSIKQSFRLVMRWRNIYNWGFQEKQGQIKNCNLDKAAQRVGVPRKSLEDYFLLLRIGKELEFNFSKFKQQKIGFLRQFIKSAPKMSKQRQKKINLQKIKQKNRIQEDYFFRVVGRQLQIQQIVETENEQKLYDVLIIDEESPRSHSDEQMIPGELEE